MNTRRVNVRGIIYKDGKLLLVRNKRDDGSENAYWATPGGGLDPAESLEQGLTRELIEELGITPVIGKLLFIQQFNDSERSDEELEFFFEVKNVADYEAIDLSSTTHGLIEISRVEFVDLKTSDRVMPEFLKTVDIESYINEEHSPFIWNELK